jgi:hypothetical protein
MEMELVQQLSSAKYNIVQRLVWEKYAITFYSVKPPAAISISKKFADHMMLNTATEFPVQFSCL